MAAEDSARPHASFARKNEDLFRKHFPSGLDEQSAVLKAHLLIESMLRDFCMRSVDHPEYLQSARLTFNQISLLGRSMFALPVKSLDYAWTLVSKLNSLRNVMAHELEPDQARMDNLRESIIKMVNENASDPKVSFDSLKDAVCYMCGLMDALLSFSLAMKDPEFIALGEKDSTSEAVAATEETDGSEKPSSEGGQ